MIRFLFIIILLFIFLTCQESSEKQKSYSDVLDEWYTLNPGSTLKCEYCNETNNLLIEWEQEVKNGEKVPCMKVKGWICEKCQKRKKLKINHTHTVIRINYEPYLVTTNIYINITVGNPNITNISTNICTNGVDNLMWAMPHKLAKKYFDITNKKEYTLNDIGKRFGIEEIGDVKSYNESYNKISQLTFIGMHKEDVELLKWKDKYTNWKIGDTGYITKKSR